MFRGRFCRGDKGDRGDGGAALAPGRERVRASLFFGTGGGVPSEKYLTWCWDGSEQHSRKDSAINMQDFEMPQFFDTT